MLVDKTLTSRLEWRAWDIFTKKPVGAVAFTEASAEATFIAKTTGGRKEAIGDLDPRRDLSGNIAVSQDKKVAFVKKGHILVEIEPVSYELTGLHYATWRAKVQRHPVHLGHVLLSNPSDGEQKWDNVTSVVAFNASYSFYYGQLTGLIRALPARSETYGGGERHEVIEYAWGLPKKFSRHRIQRVSASLMTGTQVNVSVDAMMTTTELPYEATLISTFKDGQRREHSISGTYQETLLTNVIVSKVSLSRSF